MFCFDISQCGHLLDCEVSLFASILELFPEGDHIGTGVRILEWAFSARFYPCRESSK